jgi:DNA primase
LHYVGWWKNLAIGYLAYQRGTKVYIDAGQNDHADTLAAPYSIRPYH